MYFPSRKAHIKQIHGYLFFPFFKLSGESFSSKSLLNGLASLIDRNCRSHYFFRGPVDGEGNS